MEAGFGYRRDAPSMGDIEALTYQGQRITDHAPRPRGSGTHFGGWIGSTAGRAARIGGGGS